eukprot:Nitzschia sp. Nitz4//scaffold225_size51843//50//1036//NITZ4_006890-RA/size51843-processed-gene-0.12-mRNA-1//1//CDS//3329542660//8669//frame0
MPGLDSKQIRANITTMEDEGNISWYRHRKSMKARFGSTAQFIFTVGLEGTGHHWMASLAKGSPAFKRLTDAGIRPDMQKSLELNLFQHYTKFDTDTQKPGLFNSHCSTGDTRPIERFRAVVSWLKKIDEAAKAQPGVNRTLPFPVNTAAAGPNYGMLSYPNYSGACKSSNYPDLTMFFQACDKAKVDCFLVYIHRNPADILRSVTINRHFLPSFYAASRLYSTMLHAISGQIHNFPNRVLGCFDFYTKEIQGWYDAPLDLWDWSLEPDRYEDMVNSTYEAPERNHTLYYEIEQMSLDPGAPHMKSFFSQHYQTLNLCRRIVGKSTTRL